MKNISTNKLWAKKESNERLPDFIDPNASSEELMHEYGFGLTEKVGKGYDAVVVAVNHKEYLTLDNT